MRIFIINTLCLLGTSLLRVDGVSLPPDCAPSQTLVGQNCYRVYLRNSTWDEAYETCYHNHSGALVNLSTPSIRAEVGELMGNYSTGRFWIGARTEFQKPFFWVKVNPGFNLQPVGTPLSLRSAEPVNRMEWEDIHGNTSGTCGLINPAKYSWEFQSCDQRNLGFICQYEKRSPLRLQLITRYYSLFPDPQMIITARTSGYPYPNIRWYKNSKDITGFNTSSYDVIVTQDKLIINQITNASVGTYTCIATNIYESVEEFLNITAETAMIKEPRFLRPGKTVELTCEADNDPLPHVTWKKDGHRVVNTDKISTDWVEMLKGGISRLVIQNMTLADQGVYSCSASGRPRTETLVMLTNHQDRLIDKSFLTEENNGSVFTILTENLARQSTPNDVLYAINILQALFPGAVPLDRVDHELQELTESIGLIFNSVNKVDYPQEAVQQELTESIGLIFNSMNKGVFSQGADAQQAAQCENEKRDCWFDWLNNTRTFALKVLDMATVVILENSPNNSPQLRKKKDRLFDYLRAVEGATLNLQESVNISITVGGIAIDVRSRTTGEWCDEPRMVVAEIWMSEHVCRLSSIYPSASIGLAPDVGRRVSIIQARFPRLAEEVSSASIRTSVVSDTLSYIVVVDGLTVSVPVEFKLQPNTAYKTGPHHNLTHRWNFLCGFMIEENMQTTGDDVDVSSPLPGWSTEGCSLLSVVNDAIVCACNHTTNFALLMQVMPLKISAAHAQALSIMTYVGCGISMVCLVLALTVFTILRLYVEDRIYNHINLIVTLLFLQGVFLSGVGQVEHQTLCTVVTVLLHYLCLSVFCWMLVEGVHLYYQLVVVFGTGKNKKLIYTFIGYGCPCVIVAISAGLYWPGYSDSQRKACWLSMKQAFHWSFLGPATLIISINIVIAIRVMYVIMRAASSTKYPMYGVLACKALLIISPITGLGWSFALMAVSEETIIFHYLFAAFNSLQGLFIFLLHCFFNQEVRHAWALWRARKVSFHSKASCLTDVQSRLPGMSPPLGHQLSQQMSQTSTQTIGKAHGGSYFTWSKKHPLHRVQRQKHPFILNTDLKAN